MTVGYTYVLESFQSMVTASNPIINRYFYQHVSGSGMGAMNLRNAFVEQVLPSILGIQTVHITHTSIKVYTPDDESDFVEVPFTPGEVGTQSGETMPPFVTASFKLHRAFMSFRTGRKAYSGVPEGGYVNGVPSSGYLGFLDILATSLAEVIAPAGVPDEFAPVLVKNLNSPFPTRVVAQIPAASYARISTQNTRK